MPLRSTTNSMRVLESLAESFRGPSELKHLLSPEQLSQILKINKHVRSGCQRSLGGLFLDILIRLTGLSDRGHARKISF